MTQSKPKRKTGAPYKRTSKAKTASQSRKRPAGGSDRCTPLQRQEVEGNLREMNGAGKSWRWIAKHSIGIKKYGYLQRVSRGYKDVKPTKTDVLFVRRLYDTWRSEKDITEERLEKMLRLNELMAEVNQLIVWFIRQE